MAKRAGRRPGDPEQTRQAILTAARQAFAANGYERATLRAIAAEADVDPALVLHHFGSKHDLFVAAHELPLDPAEVVARVGRLPVAERGEALARTYLTVFAAPDSPAFSLLRAAATNPDAARMLREFIHDTVIEPGAGLLADPDHDGALRFALLSSHLLGIAVARSIVGIAPLADHDLDEVVAAVAPAIQRYVEGR